MVQPTRKRRRRRLKTLQPTILFVAVVLTLVAIVIGIRLLWRGSQPRFMDVVVELGQPMPDITEFTTKYADSEDIEMLTPESSVTVDKVGVYSIKFRSGKKEETVTLTVRDTTKPTVTTKRVTVAPGTVVTADDFIADVQDYSETTAFFLDEPQVLDVYGDVPVTIFVQDAHGNETIVEGKLEYTWLKAEYYMEMGHVLTKADLLLDPAVDEAVLDQAALDHITWFGVGEYEVGGEWNGETRICEITVVDTTAPQLQLKELVIYSDEVVEAEDFIEHISDASRTETVRLLTSLVLGQEGLTQTVQIEASDASGNKTTAQTTLRIIKDAPPVFNGLDDIIIEGTGAPDYRLGVTATDVRDGELTFQIDCSTVQLNKTGTYYVLYTAVDRSGNKTEATRRVVVRYPSA